MPISFRSEEITSSLLKNEHLEVVEFRPVESLPRSRIPLKKRSKNYIQGLKYFINMKNKERAHKEIKDIFKIRKQREFKEFKHQCISYYKQSIH